MTAPARPAATVMLLREGTAGLEVLLLRRSREVTFASGAHVFPGGAVDPSDHAGFWDRGVAGRSESEASATLGLVEGGLAYWIAAARECFEEAGILLARRSDGAALTLTDPADGARFARHRDAVGLGDCTLAEVCREEDLCLTADAISYFGHWITPAASPRRYDTRFFVTRAPAEQSASPDHRETVASLWTTPARALERQAAGELEFVLPTERSLRFLSRFGTAEAALRALQAAPTGSGGAPSLVDDFGGVRVALPGELGESEGADRSAVVGSARGAR